MPQIESYATQNQFVQHEAMYENTYTRASGFGLYVSWAAGWLATLMSSWHRDTPALLRSIGGSGSGSGPTLPRVRGPRKSYCFFCADELGGVHLHHQ